MDLQEVLWEGMDGVDLAHIRDRLYVIVNAVTKSEFYQIRCIRTVSKSSEIHIFYYKELQSTRLGAKRIS
jgi:hypothetical protein